MRIADLLIKEHGREVFRQLSFDFIEMRSLAAFRTDKFRAFLNKQEKLLRLDLRKEHAIIGKAKIGKDKVTTRKPKTLLNFLKS